MKLENFPHKTISASSKLSSHSLRHKLKRSARAFVTMSVRHLNALLLRGVGNLLRRRANLKRQAEKVTHMLC